MDSLLATDQIHRQRFLELPLHDPGVDGLIDWLLSPDPATVEPRACAYLNAHTVNLALRQGSPLRPHLEQMDLVYPDGMSVVKAARRRGLEISERVSAADFFWRFCWAAAARGRTVALVGSWRRVVQECAQNLTLNVPSLRIVYRNHGFLNCESQEREVFDRLADLRPDVTLIGMGSPVQEAFALRLRDELKLPTTWCVGALFEYYAPGFRRHAPLWMRQAGLEWAFRLAQEPERLSGRYLKGNVEFLMRARGWMR